MQVSIFQKIGERRFASKLRIPWLTGHVKYKAYYYVVVIISQRRV